MTRAQIFQLVQLGFLALVLISIVLFRRKHSVHNSQFRVTEAELWEQKKRENAARGGAVPSGATPRSGTAAPSASTPLDSHFRVGAAFPSWTASTPPHDVLGVSLQAPLEVIEAAYKTLLKKYHPDLYASWGGDYETRAHQVVLRLQQARDEIVKKRAGG